MKLLTIHKNTKQQRESKEIRKSLISEAKELAKLQNISGYAIVVWNDECAANCDWWSSPPHMPGLVVPEFVKKVLERAIAQSDVNDIIDMRFY